MGEGSTGPLSSTEAPPTAAPPEARAASAERNGRLPAFPVSAAERGIEALSRFAGPLVFFLALGGIVWLLVK